MKSHRCPLLLAFAWLIFASAGSVHADDSIDARDVDRAAYQTVFYAVLEGCFADGLTDADVDQILLRQAPDRRYLHFIYACPVCTATAHALETYRARPIIDLKVEKKKLTFGAGLPDNLHTRLYSADIKERLSAIHDLEESWVSRRIASLRLNPEELARVQTQLKDARDEGTHLLQSFLEQGDANYYAPGYHAGDECALCNAAAGMTLKLAPEPAKP